MNRGAHLDCCPDGSTIAISLWEAGFNAAFRESANTVADDEVFTLGYRMGEIAHENVLAEEAELPPRPRHSFPSLSELSLKLQEPDMPDAPSRSSLPPVIDPAEANRPDKVYEREIAARMNDDF
jgi:hypothetical protein